MITRVRVLCVLLSLLLAPILAWSVEPRRLILHSNSAESAANGEQFPTLGYSTLAVQNTIRGGWDGTLTYEITTDGSTWTAVTCRNALLTTTASTTVAAVGYMVCPVSGALGFRARISGRTAGDVMVTAASVEGESGVITALTVDSPSAAACKTVTQNSQGAGNADITVDATVGGVAVLAASTTRCAAILSNVGSADARCASGATTPTSTAGYLIKAGKDLVLGPEGQQAWKCIRTTATSTTFAVVEASP